MEILLCKVPLGPWAPDPDYDPEAEAAAREGLKVSLIDFEALTFDGDVKGALKRVALRSHETSAIFRGWMLRQERYEQLFQGLLEKGIRLVNNPEEYRFCHHLPLWYSSLDGYTPASVWIPTEGPVPLARMHEALAGFGDRPVIVKDWVKSQKHYWDEACFIPSASDPEAIIPVVARFLELQGAELTGGLVFREFVELASVGTHSRSGMPLTCEYRVFFLDGEPFYEAPYWAEGAYPDERPPQGFLTQLASQVKSRFFTMDVARTVAGGWVVVELGDAQVAGLPDQSASPGFYSALAQRCS